MKKYIYEAKNGQRLEITDPNLKSLLVREGFELVEEIEEDDKKPDDKKKDDKEAKAEAKKSAAEKAAAEGAEKTE